MQCISWYACDVIGTLIEFVNFVYKVCTKDCDFLKIQKIQQKKLILKRRDESTSVSSNGWCKWWWNKNRWNSLFLFKLVYMKSRERKNGS